MTGDYESKYTGEEIDELLGKVDDKQDTIADLDDIRAGASKGATAVQPSDILQLREDIDATVEVVNDFNADITELYNDKQDTIADLDSIRAGATRGAKSVIQLYINGTTRKPNEGGVIGFNTVEKVVINGDTITPDKGILTLGNVVTDLSNYYTKKEVDSAIASAITTTLNTPV